jgi:hypothetical protein
LSLRQAAEQWLAVVVRLFATVDQIAAVCPWVMMLKEAESAPAWFQVASLVAALFQLAVARQLAPSH